jgi:acyl-CoA thioesterase I
MALPFPKALVAGLILIGSMLPAVPQTPDEPQRQPQAAAPLDMSLSPECRVPGSQLYTLAPLKAVKAALKEKRPLKVLALGSSATAGFGAGSASADFKARLEGELERLLTGVDADVEQRALPGEITAEAVQRITSLIVEVEPDLVVWQVGTNDALAKADVEAFTQALNEILDWLTWHEIDVVLIEPPYTAAMASDEHYQALIAAIKSSARAREVPLVLRYEAMRFLSRQKTQAARSPFRLSDLGYRCMAEHVARTIALSLVKQDLTIQEPNANPPAATQDEKPDR